MKKRMIAMTLIAALSLGVLAGCGGGGGDTEGSGSETEASSNSGAQSITASGSTAILPLAKAAADEFKKDNPDVSITINGGGSGSGLKQVAEGTVDIGNSDVAAEEKLDESMAKDLVDHKVCVITMVPIINKDLAKDVPNVTKDQLKDIFTGKITNWKDVGGPDEEIVLIVRPKTSGTRALFEKYALDGESGIDGALETDDSGSLLQNITDQKGAIGYVAYSYLVNNQDVAALSIDGVAPSLDATYNGEWPIWGYEHMYTKGAPDGVIKEYLDFIMGEEFGKTLEEKGYNVTSKMKEER
ncbi:phosphate ABC transporter substrate-binding protein [Peptococcus simiae]|uniref:phosphate ABC transporter substrate-binding protein n=1 Tax=Peptococcus simiae TaxID=1643805 RepID=UPI0039819069